jgi:predicted DNA-binding transcriptional regulator AlpA
MGKKAVAYKTSDVVAWLEAQYEASKTGEGVA